jgi:hypothetical protein|tara:strand:- start:286 stop:711 length:426 start_codon:yes stop_codon:yes gene_type:complete
MPHQDDPRAYRDTPEGAVAEGYDPLRKGFADDPLRMGADSGIPPELMEQLIQALIGMAPENPIPGMAQGGPQPIDPELAMIMQQAGPGYDPNMSDVQRRQVGSSPVPTGDGPMPRQQPNALSPEEIQRMLQQDRGAGKFGR